MKFPLTVKAFGQDLTNAKQPFATTCATAFSTLDPAPYSLPEPAATSLPGCAARPSMDVMTVDNKSSRRHAEGSLPCCQLNLVAQRDVDAVQDGQRDDCLTAAAAMAAAAAAERRQQFLNAQPLSPPPKAAAPRRSLHYDRDANRARRNYRPSIDAAAGAMMLYTCPAPDPLESPNAGARLAAAIDVPGCVPPAAPTPFAQVLPPPPPQAAVAATAASQLNEWSFGDNLQRARMLARYAAMAAAEEMRYDPSPRGDTIGSDIDDGGGTSSRRSRSAWKLLSSLLSSSKGGGRTAGASTATALATTAQVVKRWHEAAAGGTGRGGGAAAGPPPAASSRNSRRSLAEDDAPVVVRSRDSRRLLRVQKSRVGIDCGGQINPKGRASVPAFVQQQQQHSSLRHLPPRASALAMLAWDGREMVGRGEEGDDNDYSGDELDAAVIAAAAEFAAAATERPS